MDYQNSQLFEHYENMWDTAWPRVLQGWVEVDPLAHHKLVDQRRGITLIARLDPVVVASINAFIQTMQLIEPDQYYYPVQDIHLTVLSLFSSTVHYQPFLKHGDHFKSLFRYSFYDVRRRSIKRMEAR
jgi:hypothetical protein